jgi:hypothetical protein
MPTLKTICAYCGSTEAMVEDACPNLMDYCLDHCDCPEHTA